MNKYTTLEKLKKVPKGLAPAFDGVFQTDIMGEGLTYRYYYQLKVVGVPGFAHEWYLMKYKVDVQTISKPDQIWRIVMDEDTAEWLGTGPILGEGAEWFGEIVRMIERGEEV